MSDPARLGSSIESRLQELADRGVVLVDPRQIHVAEDVDPQRIGAGAILHPGTRLEGARTLLASGAEVGGEGPATVVDSVLAEGAGIASGYMAGSVLLDGARLGANAHVRPGTILEEGASTAHAVGLKQTILLPFVTLGSAINFCDILVAGGTAATDHSEVGSGFIHFNFTPWGARGDKATASLVGDVPRGVFLRERRIFLGGATGMVGPTTVGFGAVTAAGTPVRGPVGEDRLFAEAAPELDAPIERDRVGGTGRAALNVRYVGQLLALRHWYTEVRLARVPDALVPRRAILDAAVTALDGCIAERVQQLDAFLAERGQAPSKLDLASIDAGPCPLAVDAEPVYVDHITWVRSLSDDAVAAGTRWLEGIVEAVSARSA